MVYLNRVVNLTLYLTGDAHSLSIKHRKNGCIGNHWKAFSSGGKAAAPQEELSPKGGVRSPLVLKNVQDIRKLVW